MPDAPFQALQAASRPLPKNAPAAPRLVIAGATGVLGRPLVRALAAAGHLPVRCSGRSGRRAVVPKVVPR